MNIVMQRITVEGRQIGAFILLLGFGLFILFGMFIAILYKPITDITDFYLLILAVTLGLICIVGAIHAGRIKKFQIDEYGINYFLDNKLKFYIP